MMYQTETTGESVHLLGIPRSVGIPSRWEFLRSVSKWIQHLICRLRGTGALVRRDSSADRMWLECTGCGRTTPGWELNVRRHARADRQQLGRMR